MTKRNPLYLVLTMAVMLLSFPAFISCNDDKDDDNTFHYSTSTQTTLVTGFALQADNSVLANLDSVHFTVDYDNGLIYNADSLPVGTDISKLKVTVEFLNTVNSAVFSITGATVQADTTINYTTSMTKSLDFTGKTMLTVTSADKSQVKDYEVKVLVHKVNPDILVWPMSWRRDLPGCDNGAIAQKTVKQGDLYRTLVYDGADVTMLTATSPSQGIWERQACNIPFTPDVASFTVVDDAALCLLSTAGQLYFSPDGVEWTATDVVWNSVLGVYEGRLLGIVKGDDGYYHDEYPRPEGFEPTQVENGFPVAHSSDMVVTSNKWTVSQQAIIVGGIDSEGKALNNVWGYDGTTWGKINNGHGTELPALSDATLFPYYTYRTLSGVRHYGLQQTWYLMGGRQADGTLNNKIYLSTTQGITWSVGDSTICQPDHMPAFYGAQAFVNHETLRAANQAPRPVRSFDLMWDCPFIYLFGGYNEQGALLPYVWRGVYIRMTNTPVY